MPPVLYNGSQWVLCIPNNSKCTFLFCNELAYIEFKYIFSLNFFKNLFSNLYLTHLYTRRRTKSLSTFRQTIFYHLLLTLLVTCLISIAYACDKVFNLSGFFKQIFLYFFLEKKSFDQCSSIK